MVPENLQENTENADLFEKSVYAKRIRAGHRTYFIDVKQTRSNDFYLSIAETRRKITPSGEIVNERSKVHIYEEDLKKFTNGLGEVLDFLKQAIKESSRNK